MPKTKKLPRDSAACWSEDPKPTCRPTVCVRERPVGARSLPEFCLFETGSFQGLLGPCCVFVCTRKLIPNLKFGGVLFTQTDLSHHFASLTELLYREKNYFYSPFLCPFWCNVFRQTGKQRACVRVRVCMCGYVYIGVWVCRHDGKHLFLSNTEM